MLSHNFAEVKKLRSAGNFASALPLVHSSKIESDEDAFEAMICLFVSGNLEAVLGQVGRHRSEEHTSELQSQFHLVCRLLLEKKNKLVGHLHMAVLPQDVSKLN